MFYDRSSLLKAAKERMKRFYFSILLSVYLILSIIMYVIFNYIQPTPYMDEIFHIPQGMKYIEGNFSEWDEKITTLPGLYISTSLIFHLISTVTGFSTAFLCHPYYMRCINIIFSMCSLHAVFYLITFEDYSTRKILPPKIAFWVTLNISLFPVAYFFNFMFYTDTLSTLLVIIMYKKHLENNFGMASIMGTCAVIVRQTNIIWVGYLILDLFFRTSQKMLSRRKVSANDFMNTIWVIKRLYEEQTLNQHATQFYKLSKLYLQICLLFVVFIFYNNGVVVGDRNAHSAVMHFCQIFYFSLVILFFGFPHYVCYLKDFLRAVYENKIITLIIIIICCVIVHFNTMAHPYLLADNRHYTFYIWKRIYEKHYLMKYLLVPVYMFALFSITKNLNIHKRTQFWLCVFLCIVPQKLLEFRYYIIPFTILRLEMSCKSPWHLAIEFIWFIFINSVTLYIFVTKEFYWPNSTNIQRIIW